MRMHESTLLSTHPSEHFLLHHLYQSFGVYAIDVHFCL